MGGSICYIIIGESLVSKNVCFKSQKSKEEASIT